MRHEDVQAVHDLLDGGVVVPEMDVQDVNVGSAELLQRLVHGGVEGLEVVPAVERTLLDFLIGGALIHG